MIQIENLTFGYRKQPALYKELSLELAEGRIVGLLGKNGAGKSTLLKLIAGLLQTSKKEVIKTLGFYPKDRKPELLKQLFYIPEEFELPAVSMRQYVKAIKGFYPNFDTNKLEMIMQEFELDSSRKLNKLSYGQKKKFLIAVTLSCGCPLLILDEPTNGLDIPSKAVFRKVMAGALTEEQLVIISTHQVKDIETLIDTVLIVDQGKVILNNSIFEITGNYAFKTVNSIDEHMPMYQERIPGGYKIITPKNGEETDLDIELLFNAATQGISFN